MADAGGLDLDQDLAFLGAFQIDGLDGERLARLVGAGGTDREDLSCLILADRNGMAGNLSGARRGVRGPWLKGRAEARSPRAAVWRGP